MTTFHKALTLPISREQLFAWHERRGAFQRLNSPWRPVEVVSITDGIHENSLVKIKLPPFGISWILRHKGFVQNEKFEDANVSGPFRAWHHIHSFTGNSQESTLADDIMFSPPIPFTSRPILSELERLFRYRHIVTAHDVKKHNHDSIHPKLHILVAGANGMIGEQICAFLEGGGHTVTSLGRKAASTSTQHITWDFKGALPENFRALEAPNAVIHLVGENIGSKRWSEQRKRELMESRIQPTTALIEALRASGKLPQTFISASAVGIYGDRGDEILSEQAASGDSFLAELARKWEEATAGLSSTPVRVVHARFGVVLTAQGGALKKMLPPFLFGAGATLGTGRQWMSWIGVEDLLSAFLHIIRDERIRGACNVCSPEPVRNDSFTKTLASILPRPAFFKLPKFVVKLLFGEMGVETVLASQRAVPTKLLETGFIFSFPTIEKALRLTLGR